MDELKKYIREVPDFPKPGINFYDITTLLKEPEGLEMTIDAMTEQCRGMQIDTVVGIESRGFIFGAPLAYQLGTGFVPVRKPKKLPHETASVAYELEYGTDSLEIHKDAVGQGHRVVEGGHLALGRGGIVQGQRLLPRAQRGLVVAGGRVLQREREEERRLAAGVEVVRQGSPFLEKRERLAVTAFHPFDVRQPYQQAELEIRLDR